MSVDLHVHSTASDGTLTSGECIHKAISLGLDAISITDHDTVDGIDEALGVAKLYPSFTFIPGIEISSEYDKKEVHILGYFIDHNNQQLKNFLKEMKFQRENRIKQIINKLNNIGIAIKYNQLQRNVFNGTIGRPHIANLLVQLGYSESIQQAFDKYLLEGRPCYVSRSKVTSLQAANIIRNANGLPVLAHPSISFTKKEHIIDILKTGFIGVEVEYPNTSIEFKEWLYNLADKMNLIATGGSDYHGEFKEVQLGDSAVSIDILQKLKDIKGRQNNVYF